MCTDHIIHTKDDKVLLTCTDVSRKKFKYVDENGNIKEDYDARAFMEKVIGPIKEVGQEVYENILSDVKYEREELEDKIDTESMDRKTSLHYKTDMAADCYRQIIFIDRLEDNNEFRTELAVLNK
jgi:predicted  nucleic acid-binding Zn-ribbon protein